LILFGLARGLQRLTGDRRPIAEALDLSYHQIAPQFARALTIKHSSALAITMGLMLAAAIGWHLAPAQSNAVVERDPLALFPAELGNWQSGVPQRLDAQIEQTLGADDYHSVVFMNPNHRAPVSLFVAYYLKQTEGAGIHSPEVCIPAGGWEMSRIKKRTIPLSGGDSTAGSLTVNRAVIQKGLAKQVVYYWFEARGRQMTNDYIAKAMTLLDAVSMGRTDGALVRVITPIATDETEAHADARLTTILSQVVPELPRFVPH
jgi:EpsI family protein